jgi:hypothetical protein
MALSFVVPLPIKFSLPSYHQKIENKKINQTSLTNLSPEEEFNQRSTTQLFVSLLIS